MGKEYGNKVEEVLMLTLFRDGAGSWGGGSRVRILEKNLFLLCYPGIFQSCPHCGALLPMYGISGTLTILD